MRSVAHSHTHAMAAQEHLSVACKTAAFRMAVTEALEASKVGLAFDAIQHYGNRSAPQPVRRPPSDASARTDGRGTLKKRCREECKPTPPPGDASGSAAHAAASGAARAHHAPPAAADGSKTGFTSNSAARRQRVMRRLGLCAP
jgi:hypothetical protein